VTARTTPEGAILVSADNFARAESDMYFRNVVNGGGFGKFMHIRELTPLDNQLVVRSNRDRFCVSMGRQSRKRRRVFRRVSGQKRRRHRVAALRA
jgi:hypothetical protein